MSVNVVNKNSRIKKKRGQMNLNKTVLILQ